jgi:hypothetical protein
MVEECAQSVGQGLPLSLSTFVNYLAQPEHLGIITWLLHCSSLAVCAKTWLFRGLAVVAMNT